MVKGPFENLIKKVKAVETKTALMVPIKSIDQIIQKGKKEVLQHKALNTFLKRSVV